MRLKYTIIILLMFCLSPIHYSVNAETSDPTSYTWSNPLRITTPEGLDIYTEDSDLIFYNDEWFMTLGSSDSTILTKVDKSGYLNQEYILLNGEVLPRFIDHNGMIYLSTIRSNHIGWELVLRATSDGQTWISEKVIYSGTEDMPYDYAIDISHTGSVDVVWSIQDGNYRTLVHLLYQSNDKFVLEPLDIQSYGAFTSEHSPTIEWRDGCLNLAWISNEFGGNAYHVQVEHEEVVFAIQCEGVFSRIMPMSPTFTVDASPNFLHNANEPIVVFSSLREFNKEFDSQLSPFSNIWVSNLYDRSILHQLPVWNTDEFNPSGSFGENEIGIIWHDHSGVFISFSSLDFDNSKDFDVPSSISLSPSEIDKRVESTGFIEDVVIQNTGQVEVFGNLVASENLEIQISSFRLIPGESISFWVQFQADNGGKYNEEISINSNAGDIILPVRISYISDINHDDPSIPEADSSGSLTNKKTNTDFTLVAVLAIVLGLICLYVFASKTLHGRTSLGFALMIIVMCVTPMTDPMLSQASDLYYNEKMINQNSEYHLPEFENPTLAAIPYSNQPNSDTSIDGSRNFVSSYPAMSTGFQTLSRVEDVGAVGGLDGSFPELVEYFKSCQTSIKREVQALDLNHDEVIDSNEVIYDSFSCIDSESMNISMISSSLQQKAFSSFCTGKNADIVTHGIDVNNNGVLDDDEIIEIVIKCPSPIYSEYKIDPIKFKLDMPYPVDKLNFGGIDNRGNKDVWLHIKDLNSNEEEIIPLVEGNKDRDFLETNGWGQGISLLTAGSLLDTRYGGEFELMLFSTLTDGSDHIYGDQLLVKTQATLEPIELLELLNSVSGTSDFDDNKAPICNSEFSKNVTNGDQSFTGVLYCYPGDKPKLTISALDDYPFGQSDNYTLDLQHRVSNGSVEQYTFRYQINPQFPILQSYQNTDYTEIIFIDDDSSYSIEPRDWNGDPMSSNDLSWSNAINSLSYSNNIDLTLSVLPPIITYLGVNQTDRYFTFDESIPITTHLHNPYGFDIAGEIKISAVDLTTSTLHSAVYCFDANIPSKSTTENEVHIRPSEKFGTCRNAPTGNSQLNPDHTYFLIADFIPDLEMLDKLRVQPGKSISRYGANASHIMSKEIATSMFTVTYGDVISNVKIIHEDYRLDDLISDKIYLLYAHDASSTLNMDVDLVIKEITQTYGEDYSVEVIHSTQELQELVQRGEYGSTLINLMGNSIPIPRNYLNIPLSSDQYLGNWNFEGSLQNPKSITDSSQYDNLGNLFGDPQFTSRHHYGVSSIEFDGDGDYMSVDDSKASVISGDGKFYVSLGSASFDSGDAKSYSTYDEAMEHVPSGLYSIQDELQFHISMMVQEFNEDGLNFIASYGHNSTIESGWKIYTDSTGKLSFNVAIEPYSTPIKLTTKEGVISTGEWYSVYVNLKDNKFSIIINGEHVDLERNGPIANPYEMTETNIRYVPSEHVNSGLLIAGWDDSHHDMSFDDFRFSNILVDKLSISNRIVEVNSIREPSKQDYDRADYWLNIFGSFISENNINFVNIGNHPFEFVSNDHSDWDRKRLRLGHNGFNTMLNDYSMPAKNESCVSGPMVWSEKLDWGDEKLGNVLSIEPTSFARKSISSESLLSFGSSDSGCSVVERFPLGDGSITHVNLDFSNPLYIEQSIASIVDVVNATIEWNPDVIYVFNVRQQTSCEVVSKLSETHFHINPDCLSRSGLINDGDTSINTNADVHANDGSIEPNVEFTFLINNDGLITGYSDYDIDVGDRLVFDSSGISSVNTGMVNQLGIKVEDSSPGGSTQNLTISSGDIKTFNNQLLTGGQGSGVYANITIGKSGSKITGINDPFWESNIPPQSDMLFNDGTYLLSQGSTSHVCTVDIQAEEIIAGKVLGLNKLLPGSMYTPDNSSLSTINIIGNGSGLTVNISTTDIINGVVSNFHSAVAGSGYTSATNVPTTTTNNGKNLSVNIIAAPILTGVIDTYSASSGTGYNSGYSIATTTTGSGSGATVDITVDASGVTTVVLNNTGQGYSGGDTVSITGGNGDASITVNSVKSTGGGISHVSIANGGSDYQEGDEITITSGNSDSTFIVNSITTEGGEISDIEINNSGSGYAVNDIVYINSGNNDSQYKITSVGHTGGEITSMNLNQSSDCYNDFSYLTTPVSVYLDNLPGSPSLPQSHKSYPISVSWEVGIIIQDVEVTKAGQGYAKGDTLYWNSASSGTVFEIEVDSISNQDNENLVSMEDRLSEIGDFRFVEINSINDFDSIIMSNIENSKFINYNSQGILPMPERYVLGAQPGLLSSVLFNFELIKIGFLELSPNLADYPDQYPVEIVVSYDSGVEERFQMITEARDLAAEETVNYTWIPSLNNIQMTTAILASQINNKSSHLTAVAANNIISLELRPDTNHNPSNVEILSTNKLAINYEQYDFLEPVDRSTHREKGTISGTDYYWHKGIFDNTGLGLREHSKFNATFKPSNHLGLDFWMTIYNANNLNHPSATEDVVKLECLNSEGDATGSISLTESHFVDSSIGKAFPISLSLSDFDWASHHENPNYYVNRVMVSDKTAKFTHQSHQEECIEYRFEVTPTNKVRNIVIDHVHALQDPNIGILNELDLDIEAYLADFGDFFAHNKNTLALDYQQPFTHISLPMSSPLSEIYTDISIQAPPAPVVCILSSDSFYLTDNNCVTGADSIQTIPKEHPGAVPICFNDMGYYAGYDSCYGSTTYADHTIDPPEMIYTHHEQRMVVYALDSGVGSDETNFCAELESSNNPGDFSCISNLFHEIENKNYGELNHLVLPSQVLSLSGLNRLYPSELPPIYDVHNLNDASIESTYDFELRSDLFSFIYENGYNLPEQIPQVKRDMKFGLFSPTNHDWMYSLYQSETDKGSYVGPGMFSVHSGNIVLSDTSFTDIDLSMELLMQLIWVTEQNHRLLHIIPDVNGDVSVDTEILDSVISTYGDSAYIQTSDRSFNPNSDSNSIRLYDALDGIYMHGGDNKILILSNPSSVMMPKTWYSDVKTSNALEFKANMDLVDHIDTLHKPTTKLPFSQGVTHWDDTLPSTTTLSDYRFTIKSNSIQELFVELDAQKGIATPEISEFYFWNGLPDSSFYPDGIMPEGDAPVIQVGVRWEPTNSGCGETKTSHAPLNKTKTIVVEDIRDDCYGVWSIEFSLTSEMRISYTRSLISAELLKVERTTNGGSYSDVSSTFFENYQGEIVYDGEYEFDFGVGFEESSLKVVHVDEGIDASELGLRFNHWIARNGHCLVLATRIDSTNFLFSEIGFMKSDSFSTTIVNNLTTDYGGGLIENRGFNSFVEENTGKLEFGVLETTTNSQYVQKHTSFSEDIITTSVGTQNTTKYSRYSYLKSSSNKNLHEFVSIRTNDSADALERNVAIRAFLQIQRGGIVFVGDGDLASAMSFALLFSTQEHAIRQRLGIFTKGDTISLNVTIDLVKYPRGDVFEATYQLSGKEVKGSPISGELLDFEVAKLSTGDSHNIRLSWTIPSSMSVGFVSLRVDAIDTVIDKRTSTWGDNSSEQLGFKIDSLMYIVEVNTPLMVGAFDDADIEIVTYNEMRVDNLIDGSIHLLHGDSSQPISIETTQPVNCEANSRCVVKLRWDATSNYDGQTREIGTYVGRAYIDDHVTRYQIVNHQNGQAVQKSAIIDSKVFELGIKAQLEIVLPGESTLWKVKFGNDPWLMYNGGEVIRKFDADHEFQIQPVATPSVAGVDCYVNSNSDIHSSLTIRFMAKTDSPNYLMYHLRTDDQYRQEAGCGANENRKTVVDKFNQDGTTYSIPMDGLEQNTVITVSNNLLYNMGSVIVEGNKVESLGNFDNWTSTDYSNRMIKVMDETSGTNYYGYYTTIEIFDGGEGWYSYTWTDSVENIYAAVVDISKFTPGFGQAGEYSFAYSFNSQTSHNELPYHGKAVGDTSVNFYVPSGKYVVFIGNTEFNAISEFSIEDITFGKGHAVSLRPLESCPFANYNDSEAAQAKRAAAANGVDCDSTTSSSASSGHQLSSPAPPAPTIPTQRLGKTGMTMVSIPDPIIEALSDKLHLPLASMAASNGNGSKNPIGFTHLNLDLLKIGWEQASFQSNLRLYIKIPFLADVGGVKIKAVIEAEVFLSVRFFQKYCMSPNLDLNPDIQVYNNPDPNCLHDIIAVPGEVEKMLADLDNFVGWWSVLTVSFQIDMGRLIPAFNEFQQYIFYDGFECSGVECNLPAVKEAKEAAEAVSAPIYSQEVHLYLFVGLEIGVINNVAVCSPIDKPIIHLPEDKDGDRIPDWGGVRGTVSKFLNWGKTTDGTPSKIERTETGARFAGLMTKAQTEGNLCPKSNNFQIDPSKGLPTSVSFEVAVNVGAEFVLEVKIKIAKKFAGKTIGTLGSKISESLSKAKEASSFASEYADKLNKLRDEVTKICKYKLEKAITPSFSACKNKELDQKSPRGKKELEASKNLRNYANEKEVQKKNADDASKSKTKFRKSFSTPVELEFSFTVKVGIYFGFEADCLTGSSADPDHECSYLIDFEFVFFVKVEIKVTLFKICIFVCWTPSISVSASLTLDKVLFVLMINYPPEKFKNGKPPGGIAGHFMAVDRGSSFACYGEYGNTVGSAVNRFKFGKPEMLAIQLNKQKRPSIYGGDMTTDIGDAISGDSDSAVGSGIMAEDNLDTSSATYQNSEIVLTVLFFKLKFDIPDAGCS